ncbi:hypothetical protein HMPREF0670_02826 [Prevotella sp. oral taxon 317 str. F0108]|nr:hypothetical protein HMPREF0670_02826 [Prevotella sp. oral taxon 317 str. F0108]
MVILQCREQPAVPVVGEVQETAAGIVHAHGAVYRPTFPVVKGTVGRCGIGLPHYPCTRIRPALPQLHPAVVFLGGAHLHYGERQGLALLGVVVGRHTGLEVGHDETVVAAHHAVAHHARVGHVAEPAAAHGQGVVAAQFEVVPGEVHRARHQVHRLETETAKRVGDGVLPELAHQHVVEPRKPLARDAPQETHRLHGHGAHQDVGQGILVRYERAAHHHGLSEGQRHVQRERVLVEPEPRGREELVAERGAPAGEHLRGERTAALAAVGRHALRAEVHLAVVRALQVAVEYLVGGQAARDVLDGDDVSHHAGIGGKPSLPF